MDEVTYLDSIKLRAGWQYPTTGLVELACLYADEGIAPPYAPQLHRPSFPATASERSHRSSEIDKLVAFTNPYSSSRLTAVGVAFPQLLTARNRSLRVFVASDILKRDSRTGDVFINPTVEPVKGAGQSWLLETCFSAPGLAVNVLRWNEVIITSHGRQPIRAKGTFARIIQRKYNHLDGCLCIDTGLGQGSRLFYVPPEQEDDFFDRYYPRKTLDGLKDWPLVPKDQWRAMKVGHFSLQEYVNLI